MNGTTEVAVGGRTYRMHRFDRAGNAVHELPFVIKIIVENLLRHSRQGLVDEEQLDLAVSWTPNDDRRRAVPLFPSRVLMQDYTAVPAIADLMAIRESTHERPEVSTRGHFRPPMRVDVVLDHSLTVDVAGVAGAASQNEEIDGQRNRERYDFLRWAGNAIDGIRVLPPNVGICHQLNLEYLSTVVSCDDSGVLSPDTVVGLDSHTPMVGGIGVVGWGLGGIEAEAVILGEPLWLRLPDVVGVRLVGRLPDTSTTTDLALHVTEKLRTLGVLGRFVEFHGPGLSSLRAETRAALANMAPEFGASGATFPIDDAVLHYLGLTGRTAEAIGRVEAYAKEQGLWHDKEWQAHYTAEATIDLTAVHASIAGPSHPAERFGISEARTRFAALMAVSTRPGATYAVTTQCPSPAPASADDESTTHSAESLAQSVEIDVNDRSHVNLRDGHVVIAAITSCTNTSDPTAMLAAGIVAERAALRGLTSQPWVKASLAPGSMVVSDYLEAAGLLDALTRVGFFLVGYGCTTCCGNSGPLSVAISRAIEERDLQVASVLSGNRNFAGRIHQSVRLNYLASPPLVVAFALAGTVNIDLDNEPLGYDANGDPVFLRELWPTHSETIELAREVIRPGLFTDRYDALDPDAARPTVACSPVGRHFPWDSTSTFIRRPPFLDDLPDDPTPASDIRGARALVVLGDNVSTDHISPAGPIPPGSPAGCWLTDHGVALANLGTYGARRGNHEVMIRGTFASPRLRNALIGRSESGDTLFLPRGDRMRIYDAAMLYCAEATSLVVLAGKNYGAGSSRDWAAKGTALLGVRAVIAESFEPIHRANLIAMGVLPLELPDPVEELRISGRERFDICGLTDWTEGDAPESLTLSIDDKIRASVRCRIDTPHEATYFRHGGILPYIRRTLN